MYVSVREGHAHMSAEASVGYKGPSEPLKVESLVRTMIHFQLAFICSVW